MKQQVWSDSIATAAAETAAEAEATAATNCVLFLLPALESSDSTLSTLAHAIALTEWPVYPASQTDPAIPSYARLKIENSLLAAQLILDTLRKETLKENSDQSVLVLLRVWLFQVKSNLLGPLQSSYAQELCEDAVGSAEKEEEAKKKIEDVAAKIESTTAEITVVLENAHFSLETAQFSVPLPSTATATTASTATLFSDVSAQNEDSSSAPDFLEKQNHP